MRKVTKQEFDEYIKNYPRKLDSNYFMEWLDYYDFPSEDYHPKDLEDLYSHKVARHYMNPWGEDEYYIEEKENDNID